MPCSRASFRAKGLANTLSLGDGGAAGGGASGITGGDETMGVGSGGGADVGGGGAGGASATVSVGC